jgi:hypothetical protein
MHTRFAAKPNQHTALTCDTHIITSPKSWLPGCRNSVVPVVLQLQRLPHRAQHISASLLRGHGTRQWPATQADPPRSSLLWHCLTCVPAHPLSTCVLCRYALQLDAMVDEADTSSGSYFKSQGEGKT